MVAVSFDDALSKLHGVRRRIVPRGRSFDWLAAKGEGLAVLDWDIDPRALFEDIDEINCAVPGLAEKLRQSLARAPFRIRESQIHHAA